MGAAKAGEPTRRVWNATARGASATCAASPVNVCKDCVVRDKKRKEGVRKYREMLEKAVIHVHALDDVDGHAERDLMTIQTALSTGLQGFCELNVETSAAAFDALVMLREKINQDLANKMGDGQRQLAGGGGL